MRSWASSTWLGTNRRQAVLRGGVAAVLLGALVWALPVRQPGEEGGHHAAHEPALDPFERAGVTELADGQRGPAFELETLAGGRASLATWSDHLVVLNFWATWCTPCTVEMPTLEALWREYRERGLVVVGISVDRGAPRPLIEPYVRHLDLTFPILLDPDMRVAAAWRAWSLPATFLVRPDGEVAGMALGAREWNSQEMRALLESLLPARAPGGASVTRGRSRRHGRPPREVSLRRTHSPAARGAARRSQTHPRWADVPPRASISRSPRVYDTVVLLCRRPHRQAPRHRPADGRGLTPAGPGPSPHAEPPRESNVCPATAAGR